MLFVSAVDTTVRSTSGRSVEFKRGVETHVPEAMVSEVMALGILPVEAFNEMVELAKQRAAEAAAAAAPAPEAKPAKK
jgi:hypothetical protein